MTTKASIVGILLLAVSGSQFVSAAEPNQFVVIPDVAAVTVVAKDYQVTGKRVINADVANPDAMACKSVCPLPSSSGARPGNS